jgi:hypothetical protein
VGGLGGLGGGGQVGAAFSQGGFDADKAIDGVAAGENNGWAYYGQLAHAQVRVDSPGRLE